MRVDRIAHLIERANAMARSFLPSLAPRRALLMLWWLRLVPLMHVCRASACVRNLDQVVFLDETWIDWSATLPRFGRAPKGVRALLPLNQEAGQRLNLVCAYTNDGLVKYSIRSWAAIRDSRIPRSRIAPPASADGSGPPSAARPPPFWASPSSVQAAPPQCLRQYSHKIM